MKNKKAMSSFEFLMYIPRILFITAVAFIMIAIIMGYVNVTSDVAEIQANMFVYRVLYSRNSFSLFDSDLGRVYPGIINESKFKSQNAENFLEKSIYYGGKQKFTGASFSLEDLYDKTKNEIFYNKDFFTEQNELIKAGLSSGPGGAKSIIKKYNVVILKDDGASHKGVLEINVIIPNS